MTARVPAAAAVAVLVTASATAAGSTASVATAARVPQSPSPRATADGAVPLAPDEAESLAAAADPVHEGEETTTVSPATALAAATAPGADTSTEPGLTLSEALGFPAGTEARPDLTAFANLTMCWADRAWWQWGTWPYEQRLIDTTYWCAVYGERITYRATTVTTSGTLCGTNWRTHQLIGGGVGFHGMTIRSSAGFACPTVIPWVTLHPSHDLYVYRSDRGVAKITGAS